MAKKRATVPEHRLTKAERQRWERVYCIAVGALITHHGSRMSPLGVAHLATEHADAAAELHLNGRGVTL